VGVPKKPIPPFPIIEIIGPPDIGKTPIANLVASRLNGNVLTFPILDPTSATGNLLLTNLTTNLPLLEKAPQWWAHIYIANTFEQKERILALQKAGPVVLVNYLHSFRTFNKSIGANTTLTGYSAGLPEPDYMFHLQGPEWLERASNLLLAYTPEVRAKLRKSFNTCKVPGAVRLKIEESMNKTQRINYVAVQITDTISKKFKLPVNHEILYARDQFN